MDDRPAGRVGSRSRRRGQSSAQSERDFSSVVRAADMLSRVNEETSVQAVELLRLRMRACGVDYEADY